MSTNGSIDEETIKTCSGQFDLESVFKLTMCAPVCLPGSTAIIAMPLDSEAGRRTGES